MYMLTIVDVRLCAAATMCGGMVIWCRYPGEIGHTRRRDLVTAGSDGTVK